MNKVKAAAFSALLLVGGAPALMPTAALAAPMPAASASAPAANANATQGNKAQAKDAASEYDVSEFYNDPKRYKIGDVVPDIFRTKEYQIDNWSIRHLPAPDADSHWTYMAGYYVLITNDQGKIKRALNSQIFY
ncbi:hypothetical protein TUM12370_37180 [Salmonella enterica subsp. enterica serovar Choleraesuis]|nr:hypothetical protein TUM12370_37180 [Salmonella enterica subsp. enterica serovar Choleraesuis]